MQPNKLDCAFPILVLRAVSFSYIGWQWHDLDPDGSFSTGLHIDESMEYSQKKRRYSF